MQPDSEVKGEPETSPRIGARLELKRVLGLWSAVSIVIGTVIGSGIFLVPHKMIHDVGSVSMIFIIWIVAGILSLLGALTYAELAAAMPEAGGEYVYLREAYSPFWGFLYGWTQLWVAKSGSVATLATGFYLYLTVFFPILGKSVLVINYPIGPDGGPLEIRYGQLLAVVLILGLAVVNYCGVRAGGAVQVFFTVLKMSLLAGVILLGLVSSKGDMSHLHSSIPAIGGVAGFFAAMVSALWAYDGWNNVSMVSSEIMQPQKNLPRALIFGTCAVIATYIGINLAYFYVLSPEQVGTSERVAADMMNFAYGRNAVNFVTSAVLISIFAALNGSILSGSRIPYAMARDGLFFKSIARIHPTHYTPGNSILALCIWSCVLVLSGWFDQLYTYVIFGSWILYSMTAVSVIVLRKRRPEMVRPYRTLGYPIVPLAFVGVAALLLANTLVHSPRESLMGLCLMIASIPFYLYWNSKKRVNLP